MITTNDEKRELSLKDMVKSISNRIGLKEGRTKGENIEIEDKVVTLVDYDFIHKEDKTEYSIYVIKELDEFFFFGGMMLTDYLKELDSMGAREKIQTEGLPLRLTKKKSKAGRYYYHVELFPDSKN